MARRIRGQLIDGFLETTPQPTLGLDRSGTVRFASSSFQVLYPTLKMDSVLWHCLPSDDLVRWISDCLDSTDPASREQIMTHIPERLFMAKLDPVWGEQGRCAGWILALTDVVVPVQPISQGLDQLLAEVRNGLSRPLAGIKSRLEVLLEGAYKETDVLVELLQQLNEDSNQLARLLFALEEPQRDKDLTLPQGISTSLKSIVQAVHSRFDPLARSKNLALKNQVDRTPDLKTVSEDEIHLCLTNLVDNAIKYTALHGYGEIVIGAEFSGDSVTLRVDDSGPGVPKLAREAVFEQFYRLTEGPTAQLGGTGLGLWRVREVAQKRNGRVWIETSPQGGAGLRLQFPLR